MYTAIPANPRILEIGTNERKMFEMRDIPKFPIHLYRFLQKEGHIIKLLLFFAQHAN